MIQDTLGEPAPGNDEWRPDGGSILGGIGQCLYDELKSIVDLMRLLYEVVGELDIAADGDDDYFWKQNPIRDAGLTFALFAQLESGASQFTDLPEQQRLALFRLYARFELIKQAVSRAARGGLSMIAAFDVYWSEYELFTRNQAENALKLLADAVSLLFTEEEWAGLARGGQQMADQITALIRSKIDSDPWGTSGYAICLVAMLFSPTKVLNAVRAAIGSLGDVGRASRVADLAAALRRTNVEVPSWLGGADEAADAARTAERAEDAAPNPTAGGGDTTPDADTDNADSDGANGSKEDEDSSAEIRQPIESESGAQPERPHNPDDRQNPPPDEDTTHVQGNTRREIGEMAEADARARLEADGFRTFELKNGSGHGPDIIAIKRGPPPEIRVIEVKANGSALNPLQQQGGPAYLRNVFDRIDALPGGGTWNTADFETFLRRNGNLTRDDLIGGTFEIWRYHGVDPADSASVASGPSMAGWTPGTTGREFKLDADGSVLSRSGPNRQWTPYVEPPEYPD